MTTTLYTDDGERELPFMWAICDDCSGHGKSSAYLGAFSGRRLEEAQADTEFWEDYLAGVYDRPCEGCKGSGKVKIVDESRLSPEDLAAWRAQVADDAADAAERRAEWLMEGGWREEGWFDSY